MIDDQLLIFAGIAFFLAITPGADTILVMRSVLTSNWQAGIATNLGICSGLLTHALFSALGLSLVLVRSATAFEIVKLVGSCYLIFLGIQTIWQALKGKSILMPIKTTRGKSKGRKTVKQYFISGLFTNLLNPKVALFYLAFLPQFIEPADTTMFKSVLLGGIHLFFSFVWLIVVTTFVGGLKQFLSQPKVKNTLEVITGITLISLGVKLGLEQK